MSGFDILGVSGQIGHRPRIEAADPSAPPPPPAQGGARILALLALALSLLGLLLSLGFFVAVLAEFSPIWFYEAVTVVSDALPMSTPWMMFGTCFLGAAAGGCVTWWCKQRGTTSRTARLAAYLGLAGLLIEAQVMVTTPIAVFSETRSGAAIIAGEVALLMLICGALFLHARFRAPRIRNAWAYVRGRGGNGAGGTGSSKTGHPGVVTVILVAVFVLGGIAAIVVPVRMALSTLIPSLPSEEELIDHFRENRGQLNSLVRMLGEDQQINGYRSGEGPFSYDEEAGALLSERRVRRYEALIHQVALSEETWIERSERTVRIAMDSYGIVPSGSEVGYEFSKKPLRSMPWTATQDETIYKHLGGNWYIYHYSW